MAAVCIKNSHEKLFSRFVLSKNIAIILFLIASSQVSYAQKISNIDMGEVREQAASSYTNLLSRFMKADTSMTMDDYKVLYYGNVFQKNYMSQAISKMQNDLKSQYNQGNYRIVTKIGDSIIKINPINTLVLFNMMVSYFKLGDSAKATKCANMYYPLIKAIHRSGDGTSPSKAFVVIQIQDEFQALDEWDLLMVGQMLKDDIDQVEVIPKTRPNYGLPQAFALYMNLSIPMGYIKDQHAMLQKILNNFTYYWLSYQYAFM